MPDDFKSANHLVLNLYRDGYSIAVKLNEFPVFTSETILETPKIAYEETSLLDYIENEELPPLLIEMIDSSPKLSKYKIWHNGCLILEVRDKTSINQPTHISRSSTNCLSQNSNKELQSSQDNPRNLDLDLFWSMNADIQAQSEASKRFQSNTTQAPSSAVSNDNNNSFFILLKPTNLSMLNDVLNLTESKSWTTQDRLQLESQIVLLNSPSLFLEPDAQKQFLDDNLQSPTGIYLGNNYLHRRWRSNNKRLANIYSKKTHSNSTISINNSRHNSTKQNQGNTSDRVPPELILQKFLATKRAKKPMFSFDHLARFSRHKKDSKSKNAL